MRGGQSLTKMTTNPIKIDALLLPEDISALKQVIANTPADSLRQHQDLGRVEKMLKDAPINLLSKLTELASNLAGESLEPNWPPLYVEYNAKYGNPILPPHVDGDFNELIIDYQLESNTRWPIGVNLELYSLEDNEAVVFNPNTNIHWRSHKNFQEGEYVRMLFFRFFKSEGKADYSHLPNHPDDPMFKEVADFRNSLLI
jgi:hypothetical protein